jgi:hypothetical protein
MIVTWTHGRVIVGGGIAGLGDGLTSFTVAHSIRPVESATRRRCHFQRRTRRPRDAAVQDRDHAEAGGSKLVRRSGSAIGFVPTKLPRQAFIQRGGRLHALPEGSVLGIPDEVGTVSEGQPLLAAWQSSDGHGNCSCRPVETARRIDRGFMTRRFGGKPRDYLARAVAGGDSRRRTSTVCHCSRCSHVRRDRAQNAGSCLFEGVSSQDPPRRTPDEACSDLFLEG